MNRRSFSAIAAAVILAASMAAAQQMQFFRIGSGSAGGTYFPVAGVIAQAISNPPGSRPCDSGGSCGVEGLVAIAQSSNGSVANVAALEEGEIESALAQSDVAYWAHTATGIFEGEEKKEKLRAIASLFPEHVHVVAREDAGIKSIADLKGKTVGIGLPASGTLVEARIVLEAAGLEEKEDYTPLYLNSADTISRMREGEADAMVTVAGYPQGATLELTSTVGADLIPIKGDLRDRILAGNKFLAAASIPGGTYEGNQEEIETVAVTALWLTSTEQPEGLIYEITKALWNEGTRTLLHSGHVKGKSVTLETALDGVSIPLHPGAKRYYREIGVTN